MGLKDKAQPALAESGQRPFIPFPQILALEKNLPAAGTVQGADDVEQGAFAGAGRPDDGQRFAGLDFQADGVEHADRGSV